MKFPACILLLTGLFLAACQSTPPPAPIKEFQMTGEVKAIDEKAQTATVNAGKIDGWMDAMTMEYPVKDKSEFRKLKVGDQIQAKVGVQGTDYWIASVDGAKRDSAKPETK